ncbi:hypothetical protein ACWDFR_23040 [Streptomyces sp. 900105755]|uniref:hypothetical protein n=1 Tax=Streptomyces sp. NPDC001507 TaxID=3364579 RepID=UPI00367A475C
MTGLVAPGAAGGAGLGPAVAAAITQAHGGRVEVAGAPGGTPGSPSPCRSRRHGSRTTGTA